MKKYKLTFLIGLIFLINACSSDFLDIVPKDSISDGSFWTTKEDLEGAVNGVYYPLSHDGNVSQWWVATANFPTNDFYTNEISDIQSMIDLNFSPVNYWVVYPWFSSYKGILSANRVIARGTAMNIDADFKDKKVAEAKCLRGYYYLHLIRNFGGVPLLIDEQTAASDPYPPRAPLSDVLSQMAKDFTEAAEVLPAQWDDPNIGRVTKGTALALLELTNLYQEDWNSAISNFEKLEALGVYQLLPNYMDLFKYGSENTKESILEAQINDSPNGGTWLQNMVGPRDAGDNGAPSATWGVWFPTQKLYDALEPGDDRRKQFITPGETITLPANGFVYTMQGDGKSAKTNVALIKYWIGVPPSHNSSPQNIILLKYSEAILYYAEALAHAGRFADAYTQINRIRNRAKLPDKAVVSDLETCISDINKERRIENCFEQNSGWYDLTRTKQAKKFLKDEYNKDLADYQYLFPLPQTELDLNKNLEQNPGYN